MKKLVLIFFLVVKLVSNSDLLAQNKLIIDSTLKVQYLKKYPFKEGLTIIPYYCDPFLTTISQIDTSWCGKYVVVNKNFEVKFPPNFSLPCSFVPQFKEGLCAVNINNQLVYIDSLGKIKIKTNLSACSPQKNKAMPFNNGQAKIYEGMGVTKKYYKIYYIDKQGNKLPVTAQVKIKPKKVDPVLLASQTKPTKPMVTELPKIIKPNFYPMSEQDLIKYKKSHPHKDNRMLLYYRCTEDVLNNIHSSDLDYCDKFVFTDTFLQVKIFGFGLPCAFEPQFSEGLCAVAIDSQIVYIDTLGKVIIKTSLHSCNAKNNKVSTFKNGIATIYKGDEKRPGFYETIAINTKGERVRLLEFDDLDLAINLYEKFKNITLEECNNCFIGKGKTNGLWFLVEKSGRVIKKLELK